MLRELLSAFRQGARVLVGAQGVRVDSIDRLNVVSLLAQGANALRKGNVTRAALLFGTAGIAVRHRGLSFLIQGAVVADDHGKRFAGPARGASP